MTDPPEISIITVVKNSAEKFGRTLASICAQGSAGFEWIVVDGGSTDGTMDVIEDAIKAGLLHSWQSEPDHGIYDAMNKGIAMASCTWSLFLNAGDEFYREDSLVRIKEVVNTQAEADLIIGAVEYIYPGGLHKIQQPRSLDLRWGMRFSHQSVLVNTAYQQQNPFELSDGLAGDYGFFLRAAKSKSKIVYTDMIISRFHIDGVSSENYASNVLREEAIYSKYMGNGSPVFKVRWAYCWLAHQAKRILPLSFVNWIQGLKK